MLKSILGILVGVCFFGIDLLYPNFRFCVKNDFKNSMIGFAASSNKNSSITLRTVYKPSPEVIDLESFTDFCRLLI